MAKLDKYDRDIIEHALNKLDWLTKLAASNTRFGEQGARLKTDGCDPSAEIRLPNSVLSFLVEAGRQALTGNGRAGE